VAKQVEREVGSIFLADKVILDVTRPDAATMGTEVAAIVSCTGVEMSGDLQVKGWGVGGGGGRVGWQGLLFQHSSE